MIRELAEARAAVDERLWGGGGGAEGGEAAGRVTHGQALLGRRHAAAVVRAAGVPSDGCTAAAWGWLGRFSDRADAVSEVIRWSGSVIVQGKLRNK